MAAPHDKVVRPMIFAVQKILQRLYKTINVVDGQIAELKRVAAEAAERKVPLVILPSHKSHVDYLIISWLLFHIGVSVPFVASGDNLMMPIVGSLLRGSGAFFIRRSFGEDALYRAILTEYMTALLERACNIEFFIEGGRSRSGKLLSPKMGLMTVVTDAYFAGRIEDAYIVPVSIGYEKVIETEGYIQELLGKSKQPETLVQVIQAVELLKLNFGSVDIRFDKPFSLKSFVQGQVESRNLNLFKLEEQPLQKETILRDRRQVVNILAYFVAYHINCVSVALPTSLIVTTLLTHHGRGISKSSLLEKVGWLREQVQLRGGHVAHHSEDLSKTIDQVTLLLGSSITRHSNLLEPIFTPTKRFELSYYRNQIIHLFVPEAIVACSIYPFRQHRKINLIPLSELQSSAKSLSRLLKWEFIFRSSCVCQRSHRV
jgi:glycerol-3-phosphate O-acyltransferase